MFVVKIFPNAEIKKHHIAASTKAQIVPERNASSVGVPWERGYLNGCYSCPYKQHLLVCTISTPKNGFDLI